MFQPFLECPKCGARLGLEKVYVGAPFRCSACQVELQVSNLYAWSVCLGSILVSLPIPTALGLRGFAFFFATVYGWIPTWLLASLVVKMVITPKIQLHRPEDPDIITLFPRR